MVFKAGAQMKAQGQVALDSVVTYSPKLSNLWLKIFSLHKVESKSKDYKKTLELTKKHGIPCQMQWSCNKLFNPIAWGEGLYLLEVKGKHSNAFLCSCLKDFRTTLLRLELKAE